ncbi:MAG: GNAT family N-acetyltransferase [Verrucomicrobia bacterium]|nr:GNAT family N-acetyltransferase [Verrucomicrobiota bacterium]
MTETEIRLRPATVADAAVVHKLVLELARYEHLEHEASCTPADYARILNNPPAGLGVILAEVENATAGFALFFENFSTFLAKPGLYLEDLFVLPEYRRLGVGRALFSHVLSLAKARNCGRMEWTVLEWNQPAIQFYTETFGATLLPDWRTCRIVLNP